MRRYKVKLCVVGATLDGTITVEAEDEAQAKELALESAYDVKFVPTYDVRMLHTHGIEDVGPPKMYRKMASIQRVVETFPIPGADNIEGCQVLGWKCVIKKNELKAGDLCVYFEIDSLLPKKPEFAFMEAKHYRVKTIKLRKQVSQGLALPLDAITYADLSSFEEGDDVTGLLGVIKYEPDLPAELRGKVAGKFPSFLVKTDEERIQGCPRLLEHNAGRAVYSTEKLDGSSFTAYLREDTSAEGYDPASPIRKFGICSRNLELKPDDNYFTEGDIKNRFWKTAKQEDVEKKLRAVDRNIAIQGEMVGPGIQKNKYYLQSTKLFLFNVFDIDEHVFFGLDDMKSFCEEYGFDMVPLLNVFVLDHTVDELVEMSKGKSVLGNNSKREGIVIRSTEGDRERFSFKVINPDFLLKHNE